MPRTDVLHAGQDTDAEIMARITAQPPCPWCGKRHLHIRSFEECERRVKLLCAQGCGRKRHKVLGHKDPCPLCFDCCTERHGGPPGPEPVVEKRDAPEFIEASRALAEALGQAAGYEAPVGPAPVWVDATTAYVPSRRNGEERHRVDVAIDGTAVCSCPGYEHHGHCYHADLVQKEVTMTLTREETALVPINLSPPRATLPSAEVLFSIRETAAMAVAGAVALPEGIKTKEQAAAIMLYGWELGIPPMSALNELYIVKGKVSPSAKVMAGLVANREPDSRLTIVELTETKCTLRFRRPSRKLDVEYTVSWDDIKRANLAGGNNATYPKDRLTYHCMKRIFRVYAPDLIFNLGSMTAAALSTEDADDDWIEVQGQTVDRSTGEIADTHIDPEEIPWTAEEDEEPLTLETDAASTIDQRNRILSLTKGKWSVGQTLDNIAERLGKHRQEFTLEGLTEKEATGVIGWLEGL